MRNPKPACASASIASGGKNLRNHSGGVHAARVSHKEEELRREREDAWVGDAVLALFARQYVLRERHAMDGEWFTRLTSNDFLSAFGKPTRVEASIGKLYQERGLQAAFDWMDAHLVPLFQKQLASRR
jgi:dsRNA-specific ribonuclease